MSSTTTRLVIVTFCMLSAAVYVAGASSAEVLPPRESLAALPLQIDDWRGRREADFSPEIIAILGVDDYIVRTYSRRDGAVAGLYIGYHTSQREGDTIHSPLNCLPGAGWQPLEQGRTTIAVRQTGSNVSVPIEVNRVVIGKGLDRQLVLYWYQSHRRVVASEYWGKVYTVLDAVRYNRTDAALVRVIIPLRDSGANAADKLSTSFVQALFPLLGKHLPS